MKAFLPAAIVLCVTNASHAVGNRVFENLEDLAKIGFVFTPEDKPAKDTITFHVKIPKEFEIDDVGTKPFSHVSLLQLERKVEHSPKLIGAPGAITPLEARKTDDGCHEAKVSVSLVQAGMSYLMVTYAYPSRPDGNDWPMLIHVPVSNIAKQLKARQGVATGTPAAPGSPKK
jgi:hypothetical protein